MKKEIEVSIYLDEGFFFFMHEVFPKRLEKEIMKIKYVYFKIAVTKIKVYFNSTYSHIIHIMLDYIHIIRN